MPLKRTPPSLHSLDHHKSDSNLAPRAEKTGAANSILPFLSKDHATSDTELRVPKRKRDYDDTRSELIEMFSEMQKKQNEKFETLLATVKDGIEKHTEKNKDISTSIEFLTQQCEAMASRIDVLEKEKLTDRKYIQTLEVKLENMERHMRGTSIELRNIPKKSGETKEDLLGLVKVVGEALNVPLQSAEIRDAYRINTKNDTNQPIIAELTTVALRYSIVLSVKSYNKKYSTCKFGTNNLKMEGPTIPIFISESLTFQTKKLFFLAREFAKAQNYKYCWVTRGRIYLRRKDGAPLVKVNSAEDLANLNSK